MLHCHYIANTNTYYIADTNYTRDRFGFPSIIFVLFWKIYVKFNVSLIYKFIEMIVESRPLHKKKKRLAKQRSLREIQSSPSCEQVSSKLIYYASK